MKSLLLFLSLFATLPSYSMSEPSEASPLSNFGRDLESQKLQSSPPTLSKFSCMVIAAGSCGYLVSVGFTALGLYAIISWNPSVDGTDAPLQ